MELSREEELKAITYALAALATAMAFQDNSARFIADLKKIAQFHALNGDGPAAGLLAEIVEAVEYRVRSRPTEH